MDDLTAAIWEKTSVLFGSFASIPLHVAALALTLQAAEK